MRTVKGWVLEGPHQLALETDRVIPDPSPVEVRMAVEQVGGCQSELDRYLGLAPHKPRQAMGHEIGARVVEVGSAVSALRVGDRVAVQADGGYAEQLVVPAWWCVPVPEGMRYPALIEPTGCLVGSVLRAGQQMGDAVVIVGGTGAMGEILQRLALLHTPRVLVVTGRREDALERARMLGAVAVNTDRESLVDKVNELTGGRGADVVYDVAGKEQSLRLAVAVARERGVLAEVGFAQGDLTVPQGEIVGKRLDRRNCHFTKEDLVPAMRRAVDLFGGGAIDETALVSHEFGFDEIPDGFALAASKPKDYRRWVAQIG